MTQLNYQLPILTNPNSSEDPKVHDALQQIQTVVNGQLDSSNVTTATMNTWLKLLAAADRKISFGTGSVSWPGATSLVTIEVAHGLGVIPVWANAIVTGGSIADGISATNLSLNDATNIAFRLSANTYSPGFQPGAASSTTIVWVAIG